MTLFTPFVGPFMNDIVSQVFCYYGKTPEIRTYKEKRVFWGFVVSIHGQLASLLLDSGEYVVVRMCMRGNISLHSIQEVQEREREERSGFFQGHTPNMT